MKDKSLSGIFRNIIGSYSFANLSTVNQDGYPETRSMLNLMNTSMFPKLKKLFTDEFTFYFTTNTSSAKMKHVDSNKNASVYFVNEDNFQGLLFIGEIEIVEDVKIKRSFWQDGWTMYYKGGVDDPDYAILKFKAEKYKYYNGQFEVVSGNV